MRKCFDKTLFTYLYVTVPEDISIISEDCINLGSTKEKLVVAAAEQYRVHDCLGALFFDDGRYISYHTYIVENTYLIQNIQYNFLLVSSMVDRVVDRHLQESDIGKPPTLVMLFTNNFDFACSHIPGYIFYSSNLKCSLSTQILFEGLQKTLSFNYSSHFALYFAFPNQEQA